MLGTALGTGIQWKEDLVKMLRRYFKSEVSTGHLSPDQEFNKQVLIKLLI